MIHTMPIIAGIAFTCFVLYLIGVALKDDCDVFLGCIAVPAVGIGIFTNEFPPMLLGIPIGLVLYLITLGYRSGLD